MDSAANPTKEFFSVEEIIAKLGIGRTTAYRLIQTGELPSIRIGARRLISAKEFDAFVARGGTTEAA